MESATELLISFLEKWPEPRPSIDEIAGWLRASDLPELEATGPLSNQLRTSRAEDGPWLIFRTKGSAVFEAMMRWPSMSANEVAEILTTLEQRGGAWRRKDTLHLGSWQIHHDGREAGWFTLSETFTLAALCELAKEFLDGADGPEWLESKRLDRLAKADGSSSEIQFAAPRELFGPGCMEDQWNSAGTRFDGQLGSRWLGTRSMGWRSGDRWVTLSWRRVTGDFAFRLLDVAAGARAPSMEPSAPNRD